MPPRYLLHIGPHKTGTTYLQVLFRELAPALRERGILYPSLWTVDGPPGHVQLFRLLREGNDAALREGFRELEAEAPEEILISSEDLSLLSLDEAARLKANLGERQLRIVFYCRNWMSLLPSSWQEVVKNGETLTFPEFMMQHLGNPYASTTINYGTRLDSFVKTFGKDSVSLVSYSNIVDKGGDIGEHFFRQFLHWSDAPLIPAIRPNISLSLQDAEMIRILNRLEGIPGSSVTERYLRMKARLNLGKVFAAMEKHVSVIWVNENSPALRRLHEEMFREYGDRLVPPQFEKYFFIQRLGDLEYVSEGYLLARGVAQALASAIRQICE